MPSQTYLVATAAPIDLRTAVREYRTHTAAMRRLAKKQSMHNPGPTSRAMKRHDDQLLRIALSLTLADVFDLIGELTEERYMLSSLAQADSAGQLELKRRLRSIRRRIKSYLPV